MIAYIKGKFTEKTPTFIIIETAGGVAYHINISLHTFTKIQHEKEGRLFTHFYVKEDGHTLYGFCEKSERRLFRHFISVSGVGPSTALLMLSALNPSEVKQAIVDSNVGLLKTIKGIGPKAAQRLILELKDKLEKEVDPASSINRSGKNNYREEALAALLALSIPKIGAQKALNRVAKSGKEITSVEMMIKEALKVL